ncbi:MAG TPA: HGxxPAAW family protein [Actinomycetes bacterium]|nr:HGxxPAAW family protein [Actinomycetes bacterium]
MSASHGNTPAAWTAVGIMFVGFLVSGIALPLELPWLFFVGLAVVVAGAVVGKVMQMMGMGSTVTYKDERDPEYEEHESGHRSDHNPA